MSAKDASSAIAVHGATLLDGIGSPPLMDSLLLIRQGRITAVGTRAAIAIPPDATCIDARGKWLIPGLIDMHVHLDEDLSPEAYLLYGVTTVRDVGSGFDTIRSLRTRFQAGEPLPRPYWMGRNIDQHAPSWSGAVAVNGPEDVPALLTEMQREGVDGVKLYVRAGPDLTCAVIREAHERGLPVTAHLEDTPPGVAAQCGIDNLEHVATLFPELIPQPRPPRKGLIRMYSGVPNMDMDSDVTKRLIDSLADRQVAITATLTVAIMPVAGEAGAPGVYESWAEVPQGWREYWRSDYWNFIAPRDWSDDDYRTARQAQEKFLQLVGKLHRAGVPILAGTDTPAPWVLPGAGLLYELELLVQAGLSPTDALQSATGYAAKVLDNTENVGTIQAGAQADFVLLNRDPLADIRNLRSIDAVYFGGRLADRTWLSERFASAKREYDHP